MRLLTDVIDQMLELIPIERKGFRETLVRLRDAQLYVAPEDQGWSAVAWTLMKYMEPIREDPQGHLEEHWTEPVLRIWRDET